MLLYYKFIVENTEEGLKNFGYVIFVLFFGWGKKSLSQFEFHSLIVYTKFNRKCEKSDPLFAVKHCSFNATEKKTHIELSPLSMCLTTYSDMTWVQLHTDTDCFLVEILTLGLHKHTRILVLLRWHQSEGEKNWCIMDLTSECCAEISKNFSPE